MAIVNLPRAVGAAKQSGSHPRYWLGLICSKCWLGERERFYG
ncbi:Uncharacterised protein [Vibrio cholerae]|nr:Uncharacterised protein [Vibrio cholerae]